MANRFLKQVYLPDRRFPPEGAAFAPFADALDDILCVHEERSNDDTVRYKGRSPQMPADRRRYVKAKVWVHERHTIRLPRPRTPRPG